MGAVSVNDIVITPLKRIEVPGGDVLHALKINDPGYQGFGESYFSHIQKDMIKAWKRHLKMTLNLVVPVGLVQFVFKDDKGGTLDIRVGPEEYSRLSVPPGLWFGFRGHHAPHSLIMNIASIPHDPNEIERKALNEINYDWSK